jgi:hypothetical protein
MSRFDPTNVPKHALDEILRLEKRCEKLERDLVRAREKKRFEAAKAAMQGLLANPTAQNMGVMQFEAALASDAVLYAGALLARLSESKETEGV